MPLSTLDSLQRLVDAVDPERKRSRLVAIDALTEARLALGLPTFPPKLLDPGEAAVGHPLGAGRLILGRVLWSVGTVVGAVSSFGMLALQLPLGALLPHLRVPEELQVLALVGMVVAAGLGYAGNRLQEWVRRHRALETAGKEHDSAIACCRAEMEEVAVRLAHRTTAADRARHDEAVERATAEMKAIYRRRLPRMRETASKLAQARADVRVIQVPLKPLLLHRGSV